MALIRGLTAFLAVTIGLLGSGCVRPHRQPNLGQVFKSASERKGKPPIIIVPGILGSRLVNRRTGEEVWPKLGRSADDVELPVGLDLKANTDDLVATEVVTYAKLGFLVPEFNVYEDFIEALSRFAGYKAGNIDDPLPDGDHDTFYLFAYDWRRDNVESAQILAQKITALQTKLHRPGLQFNLIGHSMGGLIARYYTMYGGVDILNDQQAQVTWAGAKSINKLIMIGTPNDGTMDALRVFVEGYSIYGGDRPSLAFLSKITSDVAFTMPAAYELLPHQGKEEFYDSAMRSIESDIYQVGTWRRYHWSIFDPVYRQKITKSMKKEFGSDWSSHFKDFFSEREQFLGLALARAEAFNRALDRKPELGISLKVYLFAGDCEQTLRAPLIIENNGKITTIFQSRKIKYNGMSIKRSEVESKMFEPGDGRVTRRSVLALSTDGVPGDDLFNSKLNLTYAVFGCELHGDLPNNPIFQDNLLSILVNENATEVVPGQP